MIGFAIGILSLLALIGVVRRGRRWARYGHGGFGFGAHHGGGCGSRHFGGCGPRGFGGGGGGFGYGPGAHHGYGHEWGSDGEAGPDAGPFWLRGVLGRIEATPTQKRAIFAALDGFSKEIRPLRTELAQSRKDLGAAVRNSYFDESLLGSVFSRHDEAIEKLRRALVGLLAKVHEVLDEEQRARLAQLFESGPGFRAEPRWI